jgi:hypothetical protein
MAKVYTVADKALVKLIGDTMKKHHAPLVDAGVTVSALLVSEGLKHHGYPAAAVVKVNNLKDRVEGKADCTIVFDGDTLPNWPEGKTAAVVDHELQHVEVVLDDRGKVETDDIGRPKLKLRLHDFEVGGFTAIIERHKEAALEAQQINDATQFVQGLFQY